MKKRYLVLGILFCLGGIAYAQYVANNVVQQRMEDDKAKIARAQQCIVGCTNDVALATADMQSIANDAMANQVTSQVPDAVSLKCFPSLTACVQNTDCCTGVCNNLVCK